MTGTAPLIFVADDDPQMRASLEDLLKSGGFAPRVFADGAMLLAALKSQIPDVILSDVRMPSMDGMTLLSEVAGLGKVPVVLISAHGDIPMAVEAMRQGAYSFLEKPFKPDRLLTILSHAAEASRLGRENARLQERLGQLSGIDRVLVGEAPVMDNLRREVVDAAGIGANTLIVGETGTGKELVARALHDLGRNASGPFVAVNCAAIPEDRFEIAMFGQEGESPGHVRAAAGGTLFLDEITSLPLARQAKLLRVLEAREVIPVGASIPQAVDLRVIGAASEDPAASIPDRFSEPLYYRIAAVVLALPPLRSHREDVPILFQHFLADQARLYEVEAPTLTAEDLQVLMSHDWPGNVRELRNVVDRHLLSCRRDPTPVAEALRRDAGEGTPVQTLRAAVAGLERQLIIAAIRKADGRMDPAADALGIGRRTLNEKMVKLGIDRGDI